jgi:putative membrane protein
MTTIFLTVPFLTHAFAQPRDWEVGPWGMHYMWGSFGVGMMIFMLVFWILVIAGGFAFVRWLWIGTGGSSGTAGSGKSAEEILKNRYARGEIDKEEFDSKLRDLRGT